MTSGKTSTAQNSGLTLLELLSILAVIFLVLTWMTPNIHSSPVRAKVSRVKSDMRSIATALENYYNDYHAYPAWRAGVQLNGYANRSANERPSALQPTILMRSTTHPNLATLTTPISYVSSYFPDPFNPVPGATFSYYATHDANDPDGDGWILWSPGPDQAFDINLESVSRIYRPPKEAFSSELINLTYDPTNGTTSRGDMWRAKQ